MMYDENDYAKSTSGALRRRTLATLITLTIFVCGWYGGAMCLAAVLLGAGVRPTFGQLEIMTGVIGLAALIWGIVTAVDWAKRQRVAA